MILLDNSDIREYLYAYFYQQLEWILLQRGCTLSERTHPPAKSKTLPCTLFATETHKKSKQADFSSLITPDTDQQLDNFPLLRTIVQANNTFKNQLSLPSFLLVVFRPAGCSHANNSVFSVRLDVAGTRGDPPAVFARGFSLLRNELT